MSDTKHRIVEGAEQLGLTLTSAAAEQLIEHAHAVLAANASMNLTTIPEAEFAGLHILDSLSAAHYLDAAPAGRFADLGSGAGYPGIPLAIASGRAVDLVESVRKKAAFLEAVARELRLEATIHPIRAEELALKHKASCSAVVARALSSLPSLVELASPLLIQDGLLICLKGAPEQEELERGDFAAEACGLMRERTESVYVPYVDAQRTIVVYRKMRLARIPLPRRVGLAQRQPLA
jgi:16S rRNA (guanine527-N7)-methyltransferase